MPKDVWEQVIFDISKAELVIVIGTSLNVYPASQLPEMTKGKTVFINNESIQTNNFDLFVQGNASEILMKVDQALIRLPVSSYKIENRFGENDLV